MKFDFRRLSPAVLTSLGLLLLALILVSAGWGVLGWIAGLLGLGLNVVAVAVTEVDDAPRARPVTSREARPAASREVRATPSEGSSPAQRRALRDSAAPVGGPDADALPIVTPVADAQPITDEQPVVVRRGAGSKGSASQRGSVARAGTGGSRGDSGSGRRPSGSSIRR